MAQQKKLRDSCRRQGVAFFFKHWGGRRKKSIGRLRVGVRKVNCRSQISRTVLCHAEQRWALTHIKPAPRPPAFEAEIDLTYMGGIERGKRNPSLLVMARIAEALSVPLTKLLSE
jgi:transcriptional regulator with XRE-family HTH domain